MKRLAVLGSTGSIGRQTLEVARVHPDKLTVVALAAARSVGMLAEQAQEFGAGLVACEDAQALRERAALMGTRQIATLEEIAAHPEVDLVVVATSGLAGLPPTLAAIRAGKNVALANKEVLVAAGAVVTLEAARHDVQILPIDSEHSALWQCLHGEPRGSIRRLILTASGGAFRDLPPERLHGVTPEEALKHPTWSMGPKVTVDSATLMNKGMEVIEAQWLFGVTLEQVEVVQHRESIVHSLVEFTDGSLKAQLGPPDMRLPIQYALSYPERWENEQLPRLDLPSTRLHFGEVELERYPCLRLAREAARAGGTYPAVLSAADEIAVERFLAHEIRLTDIARVIDDALGAHEGITPTPAFDDIMTADGWARRHARAWRRDK